MAEKSIYAGGKPVPPEALVFEYLSNGSTVQAVGNYSGAVEEFAIECKTGSQRLHIARMIVYLEDVGAFPSDKYGYNLTLTNGIHVYVHDAAHAVVAHLNHDLPVYTNAQWGRLCYDVDYQNYGTGNDSLAVRWTFERSGKPVTLSPGQHLTVALEDDFTGLVDHTFMVQGYYA